MLALPPPVRAPMTRSSRPVMVSRWLGAMICTRSRATPSTIVSLVRSPALLAPRPGQPHPRSKRQPVQPRVQLPIRTPSHRQRLSSLVRRNLRHQLPRRHLSPRQLQHPRRAPPRPPSNRAGLLNRATLLFLVLLPRNPTPNQLLCLVLLPRSPSPNQLLLRPPKRPLRPLSHLHRPLLLALLLHLVQLLALVHLVQVLALLHLAQQLVLVHQVQLRLALPLLHLVQQLGLHLLVPRRALVHRVQLSRIAAPLDRVRHRAPTTKRLLCRARHPHRLAPPLRLCSRHPRVRSRALLSRPRRPRPEL
eukprot:comp22176_c0_seq1/m.52147 comp22176_c0_seq1/g.52147  ORF comp22176_c0_seq1/g.52147 comp22176_c0_seq1/m.52147 type:complete len:305 (-) comp22176_c0_seq1:121-1035(-)